MGLGSNCLGGGLCTFTYFKDLWRLDPTMRLWTRMADFPGEARANAVVFVIGDQAYMTGGSSANQFDTWQYNTSNNTWTRMADFAESCNARAVVFSIGTKGYVGLGRGLNGGCKDFWAYDKGGGFTNPKSATEVWTYSAAGNAWSKRQTIYPGIGLQQMIGAVAAGRIFVGLGTNNPAGAPTDDFWEYIK